MISNQVPNHLIATARTGFLTGMRTFPATWRQVADQINLDGATEDLVDLGAAPMPKESRSGLTAQDFIEKNLRVSTKNWDITVWISYNALMDDRTNSLERKVRGAGGNFNRHVDKLVFDALNSGAGSTYGLCYDGNEFFDASHIDSGANYQTAQSNLNTSALNLDNFEPIYVAASTYLDDQGEQSGIIPNLLVVPPALMREANNITANPANSANANNELNPFQGKIEYLVSPYLDSTAWYLLATQGEIKPMLVVMREAPSLQDSWFDPEKPDGGHYYFKFYSRYYVAYTDWRLATQGQT